MEAFLVMYNLYYLIFKNCMVVVQTTEYCLGLECYKIYWMGLY